MEEKALKEEIISLGRELRSLRLTAAKGGNLSARLQGDTILITATASSLGDLHENALITVHLANQESCRNLLLSTEFPLHREIYRHFPAVNRVIHCHPPLTNAYFSVYDNLEVLTFETKLYLGHVPAVKQLTPSITNLPEVLSALDTNNVVAIQNHGVVAVGDRFTDALHLIESLEEAVRIAGVARLLRKEGLNPFEAELKGDLSLPLGPTIHDMFSPGHIQAIVDLVNRDEFFGQKGAELDLTVHLAIELQEEPDKAYTFYFEKGRIVQMERTGNAPFVISASSDVWRQVFLGKLDPFVGTMQGKMKLHGELAKLTRWYLPFSRLFTLFKAVHVY